VKGSGLPHVTTSSPGSRVCAHSPLQFGHKSRMLCACQPLPKYPEHLRHIPAQKRLNVQPQSRKDLAPQAAVGRRGQRVVLTLPQHEPIDRAIEDTPDQVFAYAVAAVDAELGVTVDA